MTTPADLRARLPELTLRDEFRLRRRLDSRPGTGGLGRLAAEIEAAEDRVARRRAAVPTVRYPEELPITARKDELLAAIRDHPVVVVAGETGSGKTTQLPKICLELGRGVRGLVGHTQPRRLAARTVAARIAEELDTPLGAAVGFQVRFTDRSSDHTLVKIMTDGILLTEIQRDRMLRRYDTLIIDEAHERSLNIDFILGYVKQLLPRRPDLKVVITSATIDPQRFAGHFDDAPVIEVSGRTYPVEVRYRPLVDEVADAARGVDENRADENRADESRADESRADRAGDNRVDGVRDQIQAIGEAVEELAADGPGDILVFLSGEREIRDTADALRGLALPGLEVLPLYARLSVAEQHRVFAPHPGRRVVLATNVAETSLTVPGIRYVVDPGTARISRYSQRLKVQRLPIEPVSQASARQRAGRCGRTSAGVCIRLYSEQDFQARPEYTDPEILRTNLASVILQMTALGLGDLAAFPFIDPPDRRQVADGINLLHELGALDPAAGDPRDRLTPLGRRLAQLPIDPRLARMVLEAERNGCAHEVLVIAAGLTIQDPRERPTDRRPAADERHARFVDKDSDFLAYLNLWNYLQDRQRELSSSAFRRMCRAEFLNYLRVREWQDLYAQLRQVARSLGITPGDVPAQPPRVHQSLLAGLLSHVGVLDPERRDYLGARGARFAVFPASALFRRGPRWVMAAELVETSRLWARIVARIEPGWLEPLAGHLVKRQYSEPRWDSGRGSVVASERVTLYGVPIVVGRTVNYGRIDPRLSRELFIRHALVAGDWETRHAFFHRNRALLEEVEELEHRARRRDILVDDEALFDFYDRRVGPEVVSARHFDTWWKRTRTTEPDLLTFERSMLVNERADQVSEADYPGAWTSGELRLPLTYQFEPGTEADGVTVHVPLPLLNRVEAAEFEWQVPGLREELVVALLRSLPKAVRRNLVPAPDFARAALAGVRPGREPLLASIARELHRLSGVPVPPGSWRPDRVPDHLRMTFRVVDEDGRALAEGKDLSALRVLLRPRLRETLAAAGHELERTGLADWDLGTLPRTVSQRRAGYPVTGFPALVDEGSSVAVRVLESEAEQWSAMWRGTRRLLLLTVPAPVRLVNARLSNEAKLALSRNPHGSATALIDDCVSCALDRLMAEAGGPAWDAEGFERLRDRVRGSLADAVQGVVELVRQILSAGYDLERRLSTVRDSALLPALADMRAQVSALVYPGFVTATGWWRLPDLVRYLQAVGRRLDRLPDNPQRDRDRMLRVHEIQHEYDQVRAGAPPSDELAEIRWMIEELRVNYFAQALGTPKPVSDRRIWRALDELAH